MIHGQQILFSGKPSLQVLACVPSSSRPLVLANAEGFSRSLSCLLAWDFGEGRG